jgi:hypothetical protein
VTPTWRVSNLAAYARWKALEGEDIGWLAKSIFSEESTEAMSRGTAFHAALEKIQTGDYTTVEANGCTFAFTCDVELALPKTREIRRGKDYGGIIVSGQCDGIEGRRIIDHKTVQQFDAEYHLAGWQHRFYLDIFEAERFDWHIWEVGELKEPKAFEVYAHHLLTQYRYPDLEADCRALALEFRDFARRVGWEQKMQRSQAA